MSDFTPDDEDLEALPHIAAAAQECMNEIAAQLESGASVKTIQQHLAQLSPGVLVAFFSVLLAQLRTALTEGRPDIVMIGALLEVGSDVYQAIKATRERYGGVVPLDDLPAWARKLRD